MSKCNLDREYLLDPNDEKEYLGGHYSGTIDKLYRDGCINLKETVLLSLINDLAKTKKGCFASNTFFGLRFKSSISRIRSMLSHLKQLGFVIQVSFDGRKRHLETFWSMENKKLKEGDTDNQTAQKRSGVQSEVNGQTKRKRSGVQSEVSGPTKRKRSVRQSGNEPHSSESSNKLRRHLGKRIENNGAIGDRSRENDSLSSSGESTKLPNKQPSKNGKSTTSKNGKVPNKKQEPKQSQYISHARDWALKILTAIHTKDSTNLLVRNINNSTTTIAKVAKQIVLLIEKDKVPLSTIDNIFRWYVENYGKQWVPPLFKITDIRDKFSRIKAVMQIQTGKQDHEMKVDRDILEKINIVGRRLFPDYYEMSGSDGGLFAKMQPWQLEAALEDIGLPTNFITADQQI